MFRLGVFLAMFVALTAGAAAGPPFDPHVSGKPATADGVLLEFGMGNWAGGFAIRQSDQKIRRFMVSLRRPFIVDGHQVRCAFPPTVRAPHPGTMCEKWPSNVRVGFTRVRVYYWRATLYGEPVLVARALRTLK